MNATESHPEYTTSFKRIEADMKEAEDKASHGDSAGAAALTGLLINDVVAAQYRFGKDPDYMKDLNKELIDQKLLPPGLELTGTQHTDKGTYLKMKETQYGNTFYVGHDEIQRLIPRK